MYRIANWKKFSDVTLLYQDLVLQEGGMVSSLIPKSCPAALDNVTENMMIIEETYLCIYEGQACPYFKGAELHNTDRTDKDIFCGYGA